MCCTSRMLTMRTTLRPGTYVTSIEGRTMQRQVWRDVIEELSSKMSDVKEITRCRATLRAAAR